MPDSPLLPPASTTIRLGQGSDRLPLRVARTRLVVTTGPDRGLELPLDRPEARVGKGPDNDLVLTDPGVSRHHFQVTWRDGRHYLVDLASTNGTRVNGVLAREAVLDRECTIGIGSTSLAYETAQVEVLVPDASAGAFHGVLGTSRAMRDLFAYLQLIASAGLSTILQGETGTGKELVARALHLAGSRAKKPFVVFDCGATNDSLVDAALFGHTAGAFTGAAGARKGAFLSAHGGTLFLDEIGELPLELQPKLLRALERREVQSLGTDAPVPADVRVVAATHRDLQEMVVQGRFREDLLYRLAGVTLVLPSLRQRPEDIPILAQHFLGEVRPDQRFDHAALAALSRHAWPGNVRELKNAVSRIAALVRAPLVGVADLVMGPLQPGVAPVPPPTALASAVRGTEADLIRRALKEAGGNQSEAARKLGIARTTLRRKLREYRIEPGPDGA